MLHRGTNALCPVCYDATRDRSCDHTPEPREKTAAERAEAFMRAARAKAAAMTGDKYNPDAERRGRPTLSAGNVGRKKNPNFYIYQVRGKYIIQIKRKGVMIYQRTGLPTLAYARMIRDAALKKIDE